MIWMMLAQFIAEPCRKISQRALINKLILCMRILDRELIQSFIKSFKATRYLLSDAMFALHWTTGVSHPPYRSISIHIFISKAPGNQRGLATGPTARMSPSVPDKPAGDGGEAHRDTLLSRARMHTGTRASGRERAARSLRSAATTSRTFIQTQLVQVIFSFRI